MKPPPNFFDAQPTSSIGPLRLALATYWKSAAAQGHSHAVAEIFEL